jgi:uncharacterized protein
MAFAYFWKMEQDSGGPIQTINRNTSKRKKVLLYGTLFLMALAVCGWLHLECNVLPYIAIRPHRVDIFNGQYLNGKVMPADNGLKAEEFVVQGMDSAEIHGYFIPAEKAKGTIVLVHGIGACKEFFFDFAKRLNKLQLNVALFDLRAHGQSGGDYCTYGGKEVPDIIRVIDHVQSCAPSAPIAIYGSSLGGAIALQVMSADERIRCGIIESTYHDLEAVMNQYWTNWTSWSCPNLVHRTLQRSAAIAGFDPSLLNPSKHCASIDRPVFFGHGSMDEKIPVEFNRKNYEALLSHDKLFVVVDGALHTNLHSCGGLNYERKYTEFLFSAFGFVK